MFDDTRPSVVILGDSNTVSFGPAWAEALARQGWPSGQVVVHHRSGTTPRHWLPAGHPLYQSRYGELWAKGGRDQPAIRDALSPATRLVIVGLGGNMIPGSPDERSVEALLDQIVRLAWSTRIVWRGPPPSTASSDGRVAPRATRVGRYRRNGMLKRLLGPLHFEVDVRADPTAPRVYLDVLAMHACGPTRGLPLGTGRDEDLEAERTVLGSLAGDRDVAGEQVIRGPWRSFIKARDSLPSHVPREAARDLVAIAAERGYLTASRKPLELPLRAMVTDEQARLREGPPRFEWIRDELLPRGTRVLLPRWQGRFAEVLDARTREPLGWTMRSNLLASR